MADSDVTPQTEPETPATVDTPITPTQDNGSANTDVEALKAQLQKLEMERNLLRKQKDSLEKEKNQSLNKELEEKEDYRTLAERATAQLEELLKEKQQTETQAAREAATSEVFKEFDPKVVEVAKTAGLSANDDSETAKEELKAKLAAIQEKVGVSSAPRVQGSNMAPQTPVEEGIQYAPRVKAIGMDVVANRQAVAVNTINANKQLKSLKVLDAMREQAGVVRQDS